MKRRIALLLPLLVLVALFVLGYRGTEKAAVPVGADKRSMPDASAVLRDFQDWSEAHRSPTISPEDLARGIELAAARKQLMAGWIATDPALALEHAVSWREYEALPKELKPYFEQPFNTVGNLRVLPICDPAANAEAVRVLEIDAKSWDASVFGRRLGHSTKESAPLAGITLDGRAVVSDAVFEILTPEDAQALARLPLGNRDARRDFSTGRPLGDHPITALAGGRRFLFENIESIAQANEKLARFDETPGPHGGSRQVFALADAGDGSAGINWEQAGELVQMEADSWTENPKSVFFIRIDFSDAPGEVVSQATLLDVLNNPVADAITEMSYGKTTINAAVSSMTVRMPSASTTYLPDKNDKLYDDARAAYLAIAGASALNGYDIVGVHFPSIGISSSGVTYAGLAGGSRQWLQNTSSSNVIIHEFGHNYGIGHASFWQTSDGSVVGAGGSVEYGDIFDIMGSGPDPEGHFHMQAKQRLNWLDSTKWTDATASGSGTYRIYRFDHPSTTGARRGVRVTKAASPAQYYWLGYRPGIPNNPTLQKGAYLLWQYPGQTRGWLLDTTPGSAAGREDAAITLGRTYSDTVAGVHFTPLATGGSGADAWIDVNVQIGAFPGNQSPTATLNVPASPAARTPLVFSVTASDPNGDALAYAWDFGDSSVSNSSSSVSHTWAVGGTYSVSVTVSDMKGGRVTKTQSVTVSDPLNSWTRRTLGTTKPLYDITVANGQALAVGERTWALSNDGITWSYGSLAQNAYIKAVVHDGSQFVACGYDYNGSSFVGTIYTSPNGTAWTRRLLNGHYLADIAYGNGTYIAVGDAGTMWKSTNATSWTPVPTGVTRDLPGVTFGNGTFMVVGRDGSNWNGIVLTSPDGVNWTDTTSTTGLEYFQSFRHVQYCGNRFLASGWNASIQHSSDDGTTFTLAETVERLIPGFAHGNGVYLAAGTNQDGGADINLLSTNGANWTPMPTAAQANRNAAVFFNNTFITVGDGGNIWQSNAFTAPVAGGYSTWLALHFPGNPPLSGRADDFDGDGIPNLGEYATGTNPRDGGDRVNLTTTVTGGYFTLTVPKDASAADVTARVESSTDLRAWSTAGTTVIANSASSMTVKLTAPVGSVNGDCGFLRVVFE